MTLLEVAMEKGYVDYDDIVDSWGYETVAFERTGDYQGDYLYLLRDDFGRIGFTIFGFGSCSGCDALEGILPWFSEKEKPEVWSDVLEFSDDLLGVVRWFDSPADCAEYLNSLEEDGNHWWFYDSENKVAIKKFANLLSRESE